MARAGVACAAFESCTAHGGTAISGVLMLGMGRGMHPFVQARENASNALFLEVLFWKAAPVAEDVRNEYNWIVSTPHVSRSFHMLE